MFTCMLANDLTVLTPGVVVADAWSESDMEDARVATHLELWAAAGKIVSPATDVSLQLHLFRLRLPI